MSWKNKHESLYERVKEKLDSPSDSALDKMLWRLSNKNGLGSVEAALVIKAAELGLGYTRGLGKLEAAQQTRVMDIIQKKNNETESPPRPTGRAGQKRKIQKKEIDRGEFNDPFLMQSLYDETPQEAYAIMFILENSLRDFVARVMSKAHGENWWEEVRKRRALEKIAQEVEGRKSNESENWYHGKRGAHEIYYTDYINLFAIIRSFETDFSFFTSDKKNKSIIENLRLLTPTRNVVAHNNPITKKDLDRLKVDARDWFESMQQQKLKVASSTT